MQLTDSYRPVPVPRPLGGPQPMPGEQAGALDLSVLVGLSGLPVGKHLPIYEELHVQLMSVLDEPTELGR